MATLAAVETAERERIVHDALQELLEHYRCVVQLRDLEEKTTTETAERLGLTEVNVRVWPPGAQAAPRPPVRADGVLSGVCVVR